MPKQDWLRLFAGQGQGCIVKTRDPTHGFISDPNGWRLRAATPLNRVSYRASVSMTLQASTWASFEDGLGVQPNQFEIALVQLTAIRSAMPMVELTEGWI